MRFSRFTRLRNAVANLSWNFVERNIAELNEILLGHGQLLDLKDTVIAEDGIYYIHPRSGLSTRVVIYIAEQWLRADRLLARSMNENGYSDPTMIKNFNHYHLLRCNTLTQYELQGWKDNTRIVQRTDGYFYYSIKLRTEKARKNIVTQEIENQKLNICPHCLIKINSLLGEGAEFSQSTFQLQVFFDAGFRASWRSRGEYSRERGAFADIYPKDWEEIKRKRLEQAQYICEECNVDMSGPDLREFAYVHHSDYLLGKISYVRLRCLCLRCRADQPDGEEFRETSQYIDNAEHFERLYADL